MSDGEPFLGAGRPNWLRVWVGLLGLWVTFGVLGTWFNYQALLDRPHPISWAQAIRMNLVAYGIWAFLLTPIVLFLCARLPLAKRGLVKLIPAHLLAIAGTISIDVSIKTLLGSRAFPWVESHPFVPQFRRHYFSEAEADIQIYLLTAVIAYVVAYYSEMRRQEKHAAELETSLVRAKLQALKTQLQPHFLFNTLHSVAALVRTEPRAAEKMICSLGDLLRLTLAAEDVPKVTLRRELEFLQMYLDIQKVRFQDRLVTEITVADETSEAMVPYLLLQPLVENAIKHGVSRIRGMGKIEISISRDAGNLSIAVVNDSNTASPVPEQERLGIGIENIRSRLRMLYGLKGELTVQELPGGRFRVEARFPFEAITTPGSEAQFAAPTLRPGMEIGQ